MIKGFRVAARALRQLGAELITSDDVALNELIKNAFDAKSPRVEVRITSIVDTHALALIEQRLEDGQFTVREAREHVSRAISAEIGSAERGALINEIQEASGSGKAHFREFLGRLRARQMIDVIDTGKGMSKEDLADSFLVIGTANKMIERKKGGDNAPTLLGDKGIGRLSMMRLGNAATVLSTQASSGTRNKIQFDWTIFDNPNLFLEQVSVPVLPAGSAPPTQQGTHIRIEQLQANWNKAKVDIFIRMYMRRLQDPFADNRRPYPVDILLNGRRQAIGTLPKWLIECSQFRAEIVFDPKGIEGGDQIFQRSIQWRGNSSKEVRSWSLKDLVGELEIIPSTFRDLGRFTANCLWFNRNMLTLGEVDRSRKEVADELNDWCGGFAVYRDNFRVGKTGGMDDDWLEWDSGALRAKGFALNRYQTVGSIAISSKTNPALVDSANRERLIACPEQELLKRLMGEVLVRDLRMHINTVREAEVKVAIAEESTTESLKASEEGLKRTIRDIDLIGKLLPREERHRVTEIRQSLEGQVEYVRTMKNALAIARETRVELLELANIGLVVEIVIHELSRLTERTGELLSDFEKSGSKGNAVDVVENLRKQIVATNKRIRTVDAMSPSGRQRKEPYDAVAQTLTIGKGFKNRFERHEIAFKVTVDDEPSDNWTLEVNMVKGLIAQVLENLLTNSVYWLKQGVRQGDKNRRIDINIDSVALTMFIRDNGPGIDPRYVHEIFRPYYSTRHKGKGLGLYIASELVAYHGGKLYLDPNPETDGRLRTFMLELPKE